MPELVKCQSCGKEVNPKAALCPFCGARIKGPVLIKDPRCPRCGVALEINYQDSQEIDRCPRCRGLWLDREPFHVLTSEANVLREEALKEEYSRPPLPQADRYIPCVRCGSLMNKKNFARISGVIIDECGRHGVWLDAGELEKIRQFVLDGGLEEAQTKEIEKNRAEIKDLALQVEDVALTHKLIHFWNWKRWLFSGF